MYHFQSDQFVIRIRDGGDEEEGGVTAVDDFGVCDVKEGGEGVGGGRRERQG